MKKAIENSINLVAAFQQNNTLSLDLIKNLVYTRFLLKRGKEEEEEEEEGNTYIISRSQMRRRSRKPVVENSPARRILLRNSDSYLDYKSTVSPLIFPFMDCLLWILHFDVSPPPLPSPLPHSLCFLIIFFFLV